MIYKVLVCTCLFLFLLGLVCSVGREMISVATTGSAIGLFLKYLAGVGIGSGLFLVLDLLIRFRNTPAYFKASTAINLAFISGFLMVVSLPSIGLILGMESNIANTENRVLAEKPSLTTSSIRNFGRSFNAYVNDNFGFRKTMITMSNYLLLKCFNSIRGNQIILGKDGWLFYKAGLDDTLELTSYPLDELEGLKGNIERQTQWFSDQGIYYLFVIVPNKEAVYPENIYGDINIPQQIADHLLASFDANSSVHLLDLREPLLEAKPFNQIYYRTDTHWNAYGAWVGYREIIKQLTVPFPNLSLPSVADYNFEDNAYNYSGDLAEMLSLNNLLSETAPSVTFKEDIYPESSRLNEVVIFGDSFYPALYPYLAANFKVIVHVPLFRGFDYKTFEEHPPEVVIAICVQRQLNFLEYTVSSCLPVK